MISGVINVRKERGMTSFGVVSRMRRIFDQKKIGHTGTLDPDAEGVLPVCLGKATHLVEDLSRGTKSYRAVLLLGLETDTQDVSGTVLREAEVTAREEDVREAILSFAGKQLQVPPMYSALKVGGKKLYELARKGIEVERKAREVEFSEIRVLNTELPRVTFEVTCSHGTYIRTLCHDIGQKLGCGGCMESLLRTRVEEFRLEDALTLEQLAERKAREDAEAGESARAAGTYSFLLPIDHFYRELPACTVPEEALRGVLNGQGVSCRALRPSPPGEGEMARLYTPEGRLIGIYRREGGRCVLEQFYYESID